MEVDKDALAENYSAKDDEELLELHSAGSLTEIAYEVIETELTGRGISYPDRPKTEEIVSQGRPQSLKAHWEGKANLSSAYWVIGVGGGLIFAFLSKLTGSSPIGLLILFAWVPYTIFALVSIWRCAGNTDWEGWGYLARGLVVLNVIFVPIAVIAIIGRL